LLKVVAAIKGRDFIAIANLQVEDIIAVIFKANIHATKAEFKHKLKLSKDKLNRKRSRLN
jgi:hypothetical protein